MSGGSLAEVPGLEQGLERLARGFARPEAELALNPFLGRDLSAWDR